MSVPGVLTAHFLVLRKTPFGETSLVLAGISPEAGQMHFLARGVRRTGRRQFPVADLFRSLVVQYRLGQGELLVWRGAELERDFAGVAQSRTAFATAGWLARFALANIPAAMPQPRIYGAFMLALSRLATLPADPERADQVRFCAGIGPLLIYLAEHGLFPALAEVPAPPAWLRPVLAADPEAVLPELSREDRQTLRHWVLQRLRAVECRLDDGGRQPDYSTKTRPVQVLACSSPVVRGC